MEKVKALAQYYKVLADETRLRLILLLAEQSRGRALCVGCLARTLDTTPSNVSQHLKVLREMNLVKSSRRGYRIHYYLDRDQMNESDLMRITLLGEGFTHQITIEELEETTMCCNDKKDCKHPEGKPHPKDCTPEQIKKCHGEDVKHHCCEEETTA